jgi:hypothetical protein
MFNRDGCGEAPEPWARISKDFTQANYTEEQMKLLIEGKPF